MRCGTFVRKLSLKEALSPEFKRFCELGDIAQTNCTTQRMLFCVSTVHAKEFHSLLKRFKSPDIKLRRFARGPRGHRARATSALVANAHSFAYYYA